MTDRITDHVGEAVDRLAHQFRKPLIEGLVGILASRAQGIEDVAWDLILKRTLQHAEGVTLDRIGAQVGAIPRPLGMDDDEYRGVIIQTAIAVNTSHGTTETVLDLLRLLGADDVAIYETGDYTLLIQYQGDLLVDDSGLIGTLIAATGPVAFSLSEVEPGGFGFDGDPDARGFDDGGLARDVV